MASNENELKRQTEKLAEEAEKLIDKVEDAVDDIADDVSDTVEDVLDNVSDAIDGEAEAANVDDADNDEAEDAYDDDDDDAEGDDDDDDDEAEDAYDDDDDEADDDAEGDDDDDEESSDEKPASDRDKRHTSFASKDHGGSKKKKAPKQRVQRGVMKTSARKHVWLLIIAAFLAVVSIALFMPPQEKINQGLDIQGGLSVVLQAKSTTGDPISDEDMEASRAIIESRVNALGATEATVQLQGNDQILVQIPGLADTETALSTIGSTGKLNFARLDSFTDAEMREAIDSGQTGNYYQIGTQTDENGEEQPYYHFVPFSVPDDAYTPLITGSNIQRVTVDRASDVASDYAVNLALDADGTRAFAEATRDLAPTHGKIVIILDGTVQSAPAVQSEIPTGQVSITGNYTMDEAKSLQIVLQSGSLPVSFEYAQSQVVGPTLGQDALRSGVLVALAGLVLVIIYLLCFYKGLGIIAAAAMAVFAILYLGILAGLSALNQFSLSLAGVAGIVLTIGMAADSSVLTLERFREEIRMGRSVKAASQSGVHHAIVTSIDADSVSLVSALCLFFLASASVKGFGMTLALGIICDVVMMLLFKAPLIRLLAPRSIQKHPEFWGIHDSQEAHEGRLVKGARFIKHDINFMGKRKIFLTAAAIAMVVCFAIFGLRGLNLGIEFVGGTSVSFHGTGDVTTEQVRAAFDDVGEPDAVIQTTMADGEPGFLVRTTETSAEVAASHANQVATQFGWTSSDFEVETIGPDWGSSVINASLIAFLVSLIIIIIYIAIRFEWKMGVIAVVTLLHDLILVVGIYALVGREVNPNTIAALLTILGYSLYDTVVVFHRINDNMKAEDIRCTFFTMANHSINQVFLRTINTTLTSLVPVLAMLLFGGETLKDFAFAMVIGLIIGSYSSIGIAVPLYSMWKTREPRNAALVRRYGTDIATFDYQTTDAPIMQRASAKAAKAVASVAAAVPVATAPLAEATATIAGDNGSVLDISPVAQPKPAPKKSGGGGQKRVKRPNKGPKKK